MDIEGAANLLPDSQQAAVHPSVPLFVCRHLAGLGHREVPQPRARSLRNGAVERASRKQGDSSFARSLRHQRRRRRGSLLRGSRGGRGLGASQSPPRDLGAGADVATQASRKKRGCDAISLDSFGRATRAAALLAPRALRSKPWGPVVAAASSRALQNASEPPKAHERGACELQNQRATSFVSASPRGRTT